MPPRRAWRDLAREAIEHFAEVQLVCPDEICGAREQAVRWGRMLTVGQATTPSSEPELVLDYEYSLRAELTVDTEVQHAWTAVEQVLVLVERLHRSARATSPNEVPPSESATS
jgi:adenylylsulfate kinase-like enzyme